MNIRKRGYAGVVLTSFSVGFLTAGAIFSGVIRDYLDYRSILIENQELKQKLSKTEDENILLSGIIIGQTMNNRINQEPYIRKETPFYHNVNFNYDQNTNNKDHKKDSKLERIIID